MSNMSHTVDTGLSGLSTVCITEPDTYKHVSAVILDILTRHSKLSTGVTNDVNDGSVS